MVSSVSRVLSPLFFILVSCFFSAVSIAGSYTLFESAPVRTLVMSPDGERLFVVNTPDNQLEIFDIRPGELRKVASVSVGMEPVAVAMRNNQEVWVVNHLSDSISIVDVSSATPLVSQTLQVGDEPRDIVFAGENQNRAFITTAHRGQNSPYNDPLNPGQLTTPGIGRADVWVFEASTIGQSADVNPLTILTLFGDTPRALAVSPNGAQVYAAILNSGNRTTTIHARVVCDGGETQAPCSPFAGEALAPGGLPAPNTNHESIAQPEVGLIVRQQGELPDSPWQDELGRNWGDSVRFNLPDKDVFVIDAMATPPVEVASVSGVGTALFNMAVNPVTGKLYVSNTEALNEVRFEGTRPTGDTTTSVIGHLHEARITVIDQSGVRPRHLNKHIDYSQLPSPAGTKEKSLATPLAMVVSSDGTTLYLAAFGSGKVGVFDTAELEADSFQPDPTDHIVVSGGGPGGLVLDEKHNRLYVSTRFDNGLSIIDTDIQQEIKHLVLHNPEPESVTLGRPFLYDANLTSSNGEASCASCHLFGDLDTLSWDLGDPLGAVIDNPNPGIEIEPPNPFHPMKGPMATQSLRGLGDNHGPMHWRGDRSAALSGGNAMDQAGAFKAFNGAFVGLIGRENILGEAQMQAFTDFALQISYPPNPIRALDNTLTNLQHQGRDFFLGGNAADHKGQLFTCNTCHEMNPAQGFFGSNGLTNFVDAPQDIKIPQLRNMYQKVGMFGMPAIDNLTDRNNVHMGDQIRGFGFFHDGSVDTLARFHSDVIFTTDTHNNSLALEQFMFVFENNLAPVVGQQRTINAANQGLQTDVDLLITRASLNECEIIAKTVINNKEKGALMLSAAVAEGADIGKFRTDTAIEPLLNYADIKAASNITGQAVTYSCVPVGSGQRLAIDRDEDTVLNADDNCPAVSNLNQADSDGDGKGDLCDSIELPWPSIHANASGVSASFVQGDSVEVTISAKTGDFANQSADWWIFADTPMGRYWWSVGQGWVASDIPVRAYDGGLINFGPFTLLNESTLPVGDYKFSFAFDNNTDGIFNGTVIDSVSVNIAASPIVQ